MTDLEELLSRLATTSRSLDLVLVRAGSSAVPLFPLTGDLDLEEDTGDRRR